jgi:branched-chain amino acid transport system ATP-binding protein
MTDAPALELRAVTAGYGPSTVLRDISLTVPARSVVALLGPNGTGKTTTLRVASGVLATTSGQVLLHGNAVTRIPAFARARRGLCMIPEGRGIFPSLTVQENLRLQTTSKQDIAELTDAAVDLFPALSAHLRQPAGTLSGGQQQMVALSRTVLSGADVILLDEVSMGLSPAVVDQIFGALRRIAERGHAILLVEQYVSRALDLADEVVLLSKGSVSLNARADDLTEDMISAHYLGGAPPLEQPAQAR